MQSSDEDEFIRWLFAPVKPRKVETVEIPEHPNDSEYLKPEYLDGYYESEYASTEAAHDRLEKLTNSVQALLRERASANASIDQVIADIAKPREQFHLNLDYNDFDFLTSILDQIAAGIPINPLGESGQNRAMKIHGMCCDIYQKWQNNSDRTNHPNGS